MFFENKKCNCEKNQHCIETEVNYRTNFGDDLVVCGNVTDKSNGKTSVFRKRMEWNPGHRWSCMLNVPHVENQENTDKLEVEYKFLVWNDKKNMVINQEDDNCKHSVSFSEESPRHVKKIDHWNENSIQINT